MSRIVVVILMYHHHNPIERNVDFAETCITGPTVSTVFSVQ
jgi:hypothetical protein